MDTQICGKMITKTKVGIIDYGAGNLGSIYNAIKYLNAPTEIISSPKNIDQFSHLILPGVGSFGTLSSISKKNWPDEIKKFIKKGKSLLGVCVGMQLLFEQSDESIGSTGLSLIKGTFQVFNETNNLPLPHIGFNEVIHNKTPIWKGIDNNSPFYFIHSFKITKTNDDVVTSKTTYGDEFISFVEKDNVFGSQFHPEKSHYVGLKLLKNFLELQN